jgi:hypothetical protein
MLTWEEVNSNDYLKIQEFASMMEALEKYLRLLVEKSSLEDSELEKEMKALGVLIL